MVCDAQNLATRQRQHVSNGVCSPRVCQRQRMFHVPVAHARNLEVISEMCQRRVLLTRIKR